VAGKKYQRQKKTAADSAPKLRQKGQKSGRKKMLGDKAGFVREESRKILIINDDICSLFLSHIRPAQLS
jgi:hypothetical protein